MIDLQAIATQLQRSPEQLRLAADLLVQGYAPPFLARYRADEIGQLEESSLWTLLRFIEAQTRVGKARDAALEELKQHGEIPSAVDRQLNAAHSPREVERIVRPLLSKKSARVFADRHPLATQAVELILSADAPPAEQLPVWIAQKLNIEPNQVELVLGHARHLLVLRLSENADLLQKIRRQIVKKAVFTAAILKENNEKPAAAKPEPTTAAGQAAAAVAADQQSEAPAVADHESDDSDLGVPGELVDAELHGHDAVAADGHETSESDEVIAAETAGSETVSSAEASAAEESPAPPSASDDASTSGAATSATDVEKTTTTKANAGKNAGEKGNAAGKGGKGGKGSKGRTEVRLSPRQRRRRWLQVLLQPFDGLKRPLHRLSCFQTVMLARGQRTQLVRVELQYERPSLVLMATDSLVSTNHPLASWIDEVAGEALERVVLPRLEQDILADMEEQAHDRLLETARDHLRRALTQRPVRGHRVLCIDAVGPKLAPLAIVNHKGRVLAVDEIPCSSNKADAIASVVARLGELVHQHKVSLIALSNGPARRQIMHAVTELLNQSGEGTLRYTLVDRSGADAYASSRLSSQELGRYGRRQRTPIWLAWRLQDPMAQLIKVDPARLRLGSYQGELPTERLRTELNSVLSSCVTQSGVDVHYAPVTSIERVPGVTPEVAQAIVTSRNAGSVTSRAQLLQAVTDWAPHSSRQAIGFLRVYNSEQTFDGTTVHPDDYHIATRLLAAAELPPIASHPEGWTPRPIKGANNTPAAVGTTETTTAVADAVSVESAASDASAAETSVEATTAVVESTQALEANNSAAEVSTTEGATDAPAVEAAAEPVTKGTEESKSQHDEDGWVEPEIVTAAAAAPAKSIDVEKYAKSWQVGREKLRQIGSALLDPFGDERLGQAPVPMLTKVPKIDELQQGQSLWGVIVGLADFGAFADLGPDCQGLIHVSRLASGFVEDPHQVVQIGDLIQVWVLSVDKEKRRVSLSAIPPGTEASRSQERHSDYRNNENRGQENRGQENRGSDSRGRDNRNAPRGGAPAQGRGDNRSSSDRSGAPTGGAPAGGFNRGGGRQGGSGSGGAGSGSGGNRFGDRRGRGGDSRRSNEASETTPTVPSRPKVQRPSKPAKPISEAMQQGKEPLRSFGDLLQFYKIQKDGDAPAAPPSTDAAPPSPPSEDTAGN